MREMAAGRIAPGEPSLRYHLDRCLGCQGCESVCPSGVEYGVSLESVRHAMTAGQPLSAVARMVNYVMREPVAQHVAFPAARAARTVVTRTGLARRSFNAAMLAATAPDRLARFAARVPRVARTGDRSDSPAAPTRVAALFTGCVMSGLFAHVHRATGRALAVNGFRLAMIDEQRCCGALHAHSGQHEAAVELAAVNVTAFAQLPDHAVIVVNSAGCGALLKHYARLLADHPLATEAAAFAAKVRDVSEVLATARFTTGAPLPLRVAYDPPCHLEHAQRVVDAPRTMLASIPQITLLRHREAELCCGSAGSYSLTEPDLSRAVLDRKIDAILAAAPDVVATGNPGCIMQIGAGLEARGSTIPVVHPIELLDLAYERAGCYATGHTLA